MPWRIMSMVPKVVVVEVLGNRPRVSPLATSVIEGPRIAFSPVQPMRADSLTC